MKYFFVKGCFKNKRLIKRRKEAFLKAKEFIIFRGGILLLRTDEVIRFKYQNLNFFINYPCTWNKISNSQDPMVLFSILMYPSRDVNICNKIKIHLPELFEIGKETPLMTSLKRLFNIIDFSTHGIPSLQTLCKNVIKCSAKDYERLPLPQRIIEDISGT